MLVAQNLHFNVPGAHDHLFQIPLAIAERCLGLAPAFADFLDQFAFIHDWTHAAPAAAPGGLEHEGIADFGRLLANDIHIVAKNFGGGNDRHACLHRHAPRTGLVAQLAHGQGFGADKGDPCRIAGIDEIGVFRQQAISGMDRIGAGHFGNADDFVNAQIGRDRPQPLANPVGLVGLEPVQA